MRVQCVHSDFSQWVPSRSRSGGVSGCSPPGLRPRRASPPFRWPSFAGTRAPRWPHGVVAAASDAAIQSSASTGRTDLEVGAPTGSQECTRCRELMQGAKELMRRWRHQAHSKPHGYDARQAVSVPTGVELCCVTRGGRLGSSWKLDNQDAFLVQALPPSSLAPEGALVVGVFDGHGSRGGVAARIVRDAMRGAVAEAATEGGAASGPEDALRRAFSAAEAALGSSGQDFSRSGTTAVLVISEPRSVSVGWTGDSRAVLGASPACRAGAPRGAEAAYAVRELTEDHTPAVVREQARIMRSGGAVRHTHADAQGCPLGPLRVCFPGTRSPGLAVSRALGDTLAAGIGVSAQPDVVVAALPRAERSPPPGAHNILVVATDGLWQWIGSEAAIDVAASCSTPQEAADRLCAVARLRWAMHQAGTHVDDITVVVVFLPLETAAAAPAGG